MEKWFCVEKEKHPSGESKARSPACPAGILTNIPPWTPILSWKSPGLPSDRQGYSPLYYR